MSLRLISVECKKGYEIKMRDAIMRHIRKIYGEEMNIEAEVIELDRLRNYALMKQNDKHEGGVEALSRYCDQFTSIEGKIPMKESGVRIDFKWDDVFAKDGFFIKKDGLIIASGAYERICILFNIAALYSQVAQSLDLSDDTRLKNATKYIQQAAGIFLYLQTIIPEDIQANLPSDLNNNTLGALRMIMVAQAQELIYIKAARNNLKSDNLAKIAQQTSSFYNDALDIMQLDSIKNLLPKEWISLVAYKQFSFNAISEYNQAKWCGENKLYGEKITRLKKALEIIKTSKSHADSILFLKEEECIKNDLEAVITENNMIYHDNIPSEASLSIISKIVLAKESSFEYPIMKDFKDLFCKIVPIELHSAMILFQDKQKSFLNVEMLKLKEATNILDEKLTTTKMLVGYEDDQDDKMLRILLEKAEILKTSGGIDKINELLKSLPDVLNRNSSLLKETMQMLKEEEESDKNLKEQFKDRWSRTPSNILTNEWQAESYKFIEYLEKAKMSDDIIQKQYNEYSSKIKILCQDEYYIKERIPKKIDFQNNSENLQKDYNEIKRIYYDIEAIKRSRHVLFEELSKAGESDIANTFAKTVAENGSLNIENIAEEQINVILGPIKEKVEQSLSLQEKLLLDLEGKCLQVKIMDRSGQSRIDVISSLFNTIDKYDELSKNLLDGIKFYGELTDILLKFQNKVKDFCLARKTEKDDLLKELQPTVGMSRTDICPSVTNFYPQQQFATSSPQYTGMWRTPIQGMQYTPQQYQAGVPQQQPYQQPNGQMPQFHPFYYPGYNQYPPR